MINAKIKHGDDFGDLAIDKNQNGNIIVTVPKTGVRVECCLMTSFHEKQLIAQNYELFSQFFNLSVIENYLRMSLDTSFNATHPVQTGDKVKLKNLSNAKFNGRMGEVNLQR